MTPPPILKTDVRHFEKGIVLGFLDLIESAWIAHFLELGYSPQTLRGVANRLRQRQHTDRPFAYGKRFLADGKEIFEEVVTDSGEKRLVSAMTNNFVMKDLIQKSLMDQIFYVDDLAAEYTPVKEFPSIVMRPKVAFGRPAVKGIWIPTKILRQSFDASNGDVMDVADEFGISAKDVEDAVAFEHLMDNITYH